MEKGLPANKLVMGMGTYGRGFTLVDKSQTGMGAPAKGACAAGKYTREKGFISYYEICQHLKSGWTAVYNDEHKCMYAYGGDQWIAYDNVNTIGIKAKYIKDKGLRGGMIWALDLDDFKGTFCSEGKYPLLKAIIDVLFNGKVPVEPPKPKPTQGGGGGGVVTSGPIVTDAPIVPETGKCTQAGQIVGVKDDCSAFLQCTSNTGGVRGHCAAGLIFNTNGGICDWPSNVNRDDCKMP
jgi:chitinase